MAIPTTIIIASNQLSERERLRKQLTVHPDIQVIGEAQNDQECLDLALRQRPRVLLIQEDLPTQGGLHLAQQITERSGDIGIILMVTGSAGEELWRKMLHAGVRDFITRTTPDDLVVEEIRRLGASQKTAGVPSPAEVEISKNRVITVVAPRGGTGKTVIATNLAVALANKCSKVSLLDLNLAGGDVAVLLDVAPRRTVADLLTSYAGIDEDVMESLLLKHSSGLSVLPAPFADNFDSAGISRSVVHNVLQFMRNRYLITIADCGGSNSEGATAAMDAADVILVVVGNDLPRLRDAKQYLAKLVAANYAKDRIRVVVNRSGVGKTINRNDFESILEFPVAVHLPNDNELVADSVNMGQPFVVAAPNKPLTRQLLKLADDLALPVGADPKKEKSILATLRFWSVPEMESNAA